jgi:capsular polysaccharide biosynthesis protein
MMTSEAVLGPAIEELKLDVNWGKKYYAGRVLTISETADMLRNRIILQPVKNSMVMSITAISDDRVEASEIANAVAKSYQAFRQKAGPGPAAAAVVNVPIVQMATPSTTEFRPNKPRNIVMGGFTGIMLATLIGGLTALIVAMFRRRPAS